MPAGATMSDQDLRDTVIATLRRIAPEVTPGELRSEIDKGFWYVHDVDTSLMLRKSTNGMWEELVKRSQQQQPPLPPGALRTSL